MTQPSHVRVLPGRASPSLRLQGDEEFLRLFEARIDALLLSVGSLVELFTEESASPYYSTDLAEGMGYPPPAFLGMSPRRRLEALAAALDDISDAIMPAYEGAFGGRGRAPGERSKAQTRGELVKELAVAG